MWRLLVPLRYLLIAHPEKAKFDLLFPAVLTVIISLPLLSDKFLSQTKNSLDVLSRSSDLLSILTGFFVAALAAIATFGNAEMDEPMSGSAPVTLRDRHGIVDELSRRRFLAYLFGYLALTSIVAYGFGFAFYAIQNYFIEVRFPDWTTTAFVLFWISYAFLLGNLISNTLLGLFYLTDRIHRSNRTITRGKLDKDDADKQQKSRAA